MDLDGEGRTMLVRVNSDDEDGKVEEVVIVTRPTSQATPLALDFDLDPAVADGDEVVANDFTADLTVVLVSKSRQRSRLRGITKVLAHGDELTFPARRLSMDDVGHQHGIELSRRGRSKPQAPTTARWVHTGATAPPPANGRVSAVTMRSTPISGGMDLHSRYG